MSEILMPWGDVMGAIRGSPVAGTVTSITLDAVGEYVATCMNFECEGDSDTITHVGYRQGAITGTVTNLYKIGIQGVDASGNPDATYLGGGTANATFTPVAGDNAKWVWVALGTSISINRGDRISPILEALSGVSGSNFITAAGLTPISSRPANAYHVTNVSGAAVKAASNLPFWGLKSASKVYGFPLSLVGSKNQLGGTIEAGMGFQLPAWEFGSAKVKGIRWIGTTVGNTAREVLCRMYSSPLTTSIAAIASAPAIAGTNMTGLGSDSRLFEAYFSDSTLPTLRGGVDYAVGISSTAANDSGVAYAEVITAGDFDAFPFRQQPYLVSRTNAAYPPGSSTVAFTKTTTKRPWLELILTDITPPTSSIYILGVN